MRPDGQLLVGGPDGSDLHTVGSFPAPISWSPDGSRFAFVRDGNAWTATRDGADLRNLTSLPAGGASMVVWSPDDRWIAIGVSHGLWLMPLDGGARRWFGLGLDESVGSIGWAPSADRLALETYADGSSGGQQAFVYLVEPSGPSAIRIDSARESSWSPDGRYLVVTHSSPDGGPGDGLIELMNSDGSGRHELSTRADLSPSGLGAIARENHRWVHTLAILVA